MNTVDKLTFYAFYLHLTSMVLFFDMQEIEDTHMW